MKRVAGILGVMLAVSLLGAADVRGFGVVGPGKSSGPTLTATIVTDITTTAGTKGLTSVRVQKASQSTAALFTSSTLSVLQGFNLCDPASVEFLFAGCSGGCFVSAWVDTAAVLSALLKPFYGDPGYKQAVITGTDYVTCTTENGRLILSFTAVIQAGQSGP